MAPTVPGDLVLFQFDKDSAADHKALIEMDNCDTITTMEGNTSVSSDDNGGTVMRRTRKKSLIMAVARPKYPDADNTEAEPVTIELAKLKKGSKGGQVKALQFLLIGSGYSCGTAGPDGVFGSGTLAAVKAAQCNGGLTVDGIVGVKTWGLLLGV